MNSTFYLLSLGCPKNEVDAECMSTILGDASFRLTTHPEEAEFFIVNTCGFIESAKREAIDAILELADYKKQAAEEGRDAWLVVTGCLAQRYPEDIYAAFPEVDSVLGTSQYHLIAERCLELKAARTRICALPGKAGSLEHMQGSHRASPDRSFAWLKVAEGCSNACAFCAIPGMRGGLKSRPIEDIAAEAERFAKAGFQEQIIISQDTTRYGSDLYRRRALCDLIRALVPIEGLEWIRLMYVYGDAFDDELIELLRTEKKLLHYIDLPVQHASDRILKKMRRRDTRASLTELIRKLREAIPDMILRTTVMVGFPGETDEDFEELKSFIQEIRFDRLGCFIFSPEEGTAAAAMEDVVDAPTAQARYDEIMTLQNEISREANQRRIGQVCDILLEGVSEDGLFFLGRSYGEAPDIDPSIQVAAQSPDLKVGQIVPCRIIDADDYTLTAVSLEEA